MLAILRTKAGLVLMVVFVCAIFFTLSKLKQRNAAKDEHANDTEAVQADLPKAGAPGATLLKRAQETARGRAEIARKERTARRANIATTDETGNALQRRATPEPIPSYFMSNDRAGAEGRGGLGGGETALVPTLRIQGRRAENTSEPAVKRAVTPGAEMTGPAARGERDGAAVPLKEAPATTPERFVPFGRLIKAELVMSLESTQDEMPLVGLIVEPVYNNGRLVIPAGTEVHSTARPDRIRNRIISTPKWRLIFPREGSRPNGRQLTFEGIALDRDDRGGTGMTWGPTDGSYGLSGRVLRSGQTQEQVLLFAAEALKAAGASLMDRQPTMMGTQVEANAKNAALAGGQAVLSQMAERLAAEIARNGVYIQVPAGKQFYVYPRQIIDPDRADIPTNIAKVE